MATTFADLEARVRGLEFRQARTEEDVTVVIATVSETSTCVEWLTRAMTGIADHLGVQLPPLQADIASDRDEGLRAAGRADSRTVRGVR